jgi:phospholipid/cholesterol/gamma-HCH transport system ATP-binding protein
MNSENGIKERPPENLVEVRDLHFSFENNAVLKGVNLSVPRGKIVAILGVSGCGKSTLLRHFGGQLKPSRGSVTFNGQVVHELNNSSLYAMRRKMGMMFQVSGLLTDLSVFENLAYPMREHTDLPEEVIHDLVLMKLHAVGLRGAHALRTSELSGGMERRVALARAIALDPMLIMYDEPFAGLDPISLNTIAELIQRLNDALGLTSVLVTYDVPESLKIADYVYFLHGGVVVAEGNVAEMVDSNDPFVDQFVHAAHDGPVAFQYPSRPYREELELAPAEPREKSA